MRIEPKGDKAAKLRQRKFQLMREFKISPADGIAGSLARTLRRCGKPTCWCADGEGHEQWTLTFMVDGKKRVQAIPADWVNELRPLVDAARRFKDAISETYSINAQLLALWRAQQRKKR
jgi:hypothetical protein